MRSLLLLIAIPFASASPFAPQDSQLTTKDISHFPSIAFGSPASRSVSVKASSHRCKAFPGDLDWPSDAEWDRLNRTLNGALLKPLPPGSVCYPSSPNYNPSACSTLFTKAYYLDDPVSPGQQWTTGNTCLPAQNLSATGNWNSTSTCRQGGFPVYVVNATSVRDVQAAVNFARNKKIRLVIKYVSSVWRGVGLTGNRNTGHDFVGRNTGAGALSIWTHHLKSFEFLPQYGQRGHSPPYSGPAARVGAGVQIKDGRVFSEQYNITLVGGSCATVGSFGGWLAGGGHSELSSLYGLGVDQALEMGVVTADGRHRVVSAESEGKERELFWALRGGGGSTYGVVTSVVVKAHAAINLTVADFSFAVRNSTTPSGPMVTINDSEVFWKGLNAVYAFGIPTVDAGGYVWTQALSMGSGSFMMQTKVQMPGKTIAQTTEFVQPLFAQLQSLGIPVSTATVTTTVYGAPRSGPEGPPSSNMRFASRLFPRSSFTNSTLFSSAMSAVRAAIEAGFVFHGLNLSPTLRAGGYSYPSAVNPVWRETAMHADLFGTTTILGTSTAEEVAAAHKRLQGYMDAIRKATPGGGSYLNEADLEEPDWQHAFWGSNYERLVGVKREWDPWGVFWAPATVGSEGWMVENQDGFKSQNGRLCRVGS
ncbi:hypothetical protein N0V85_005895 [Neurospora sp. IMI 360204]|nr:hypothetical protein N0V85_005895 [Neurospora sp. IMI 360204]